MKLGVDLLLVCWSDLAQLLCLHGREVLPVHVVFLDQFLHVQQVTGAAEVGKWLICRSEVAVLALLHVKQVLLSIPAVYEAASVEVVHHVVRHDSSWINRLSHLLGLGCIHPLDSLLSHQSLQGYETSGAFRLFFDVDSSGEHRLGRRYQKERRLVVRLGFNVWRQIVGYVQGSPILVLHMSHLRAEFLLDKLFIDHLTTLSSLIHSSKVFQWVIFRLKHQLLLLDV